MPVESAADRLSFLSPDEFGEEATYTLAAGGATPGIPGILNDPHISDLAGEIVRTSDSQPTFTCQSANIPVGAVGGDAGDTLAVAETDLHPAKTYKVVDLQPDGSGITTIILGAST